MKTGARQASTLCLNANFFFKIFGMLGLLLALFPPSAQGNNDAGFRKLTKQESWVLAQIQQGQNADVQNRFAGEKEHYRLGADFLEELFAKKLNQMQVSHKGIAISHAKIEGDLHLENVEIGIPVYLTNCSFEGLVDFQKSYFKKDLSLQGSVFLQAADFRGIKVDGTIICNDTQFHAQSLWSDAKIGEYFQAERAKFLSSEGPADFNAIRIGGTALFNAAQFHGPVIFVVANIGRQFMADETIFFNPVKLANFGGIKTGNTLFFQKAEFHGPVMFEFSEIGINFRASGARFLNKSKAKNFAKLKVGQKLFMDNVLVRGNLNLSYGDFFDLEISGAPERKKGAGVAFTCLDLQGSQVQRNLTIADLTLDELNASQMHVKGRTMIKNVRINRLLDLRSAGLQALDFNGVKWPKAPPPKPGKHEKKPFRYAVYLGGLTYSSLSLDRPEVDSDFKLNPLDYNRDDFQKIMDLVDDCPFNTQSYVEVETFFKRIGRDAWANEVFIEMHNRELAEKRAWYDPIRWLEWFFWGKIAGYGRAPFRVFFLALAFIILGACLFDPVYLRDNKRPPKGNIFRSVAIRLIISLDRFLPIELGLAKNWESAGTDFFTWFYYYLQQVIGWILIPIALASIYSQLK